MNRLRLPTVRHWRSSQDRSHLVHRGNEAISNPRNRFDVAGRACRIAESVAKLLDGFVQPVIEVDEDIRGPETSPQFVTRDDLARPLQQNREDLNWLLRQANPRAVLRELAGAWIELEKSEANRVFCR